MKRNLIALGVAAAVALPLSAQAAPKLYGRLNVTAESYEKEFDKNNGVKAKTTAKNSNQEYTRLKSNASRFGVKGEDELTASLSAVYQIEWEVKADGDGADLGQRNRFVGLKSTDLGTLKAGRYDTYLKLAQGEIDLFNDLVGDMEFVIAGEDRINNVVGYESPSFAGLTFNVMAQTQDGNTGNDVGIASGAGQSASIVYNNEEIGLYAAVAYANDIAAKTALNSPRVGGSDILRVVGSYKVAGLTLNAIYSDSQSALDATQARPVYVLTGPNPIKGDFAETGWQLGAAYQIGDEVIKAQYGTAEADEGKQIVQTRTQWSVGVDHNFTSKTRALLFFTQQEEERLPGENNIAANDHDYTTKVVGLGFDHKF